MKKFFLAAAVIIFIGFAWFGFKAASSLFTPRAQNPVSEMGTDETQPVQSNSLLILVNDLTADSPQLIAMWAVLNYPSTPPQLYFLPLMPSMDTNLNQEIASTMKLNRSNRLTRSSLTAMEKILDLKFDNYFIADNAALLRFAGYAKLETMEIFNSPAESAESIKSLQKNIHSFFEAYCRTGASGASNSFFSQIEWDQLQPDHFSTSLSIEALSAIIETVNNAPALEICEVLSSE